MKLPPTAGRQARSAAALNEDRSRTVSYSEDTGEWVLDTHVMCFGDVNLWVIPKVPPAR